MPEHTSYTTAHAPAPVEPERAAQASAYATAVRAIARAAYAARAASITRAATAKSSATTAASRTTFTARKAAHIAAHGDACAAVYAATTADILTAAARATWVAVTDAACRAQALHRATRMAWAAAAAHQIASSSWWGSPASSSTTRPSVGIAARVAYMVSCDRAGGDLITAETAAAYAHLAQKLAASAASGCNGNLLSVAAYAVACAAAYAETATLEVKAVAPNVEMREIAKSVIERVTAAGYAKVKLDTLVQCVAQMASERGVAPD